MTPFPSRLETPRLVLRPFDADDVPAAHVWMSDPAVMRFYPFADRTLDDTRKRIDRYRRHHEDRGFAKWLIADRGTGEPIGDAGLMTLDELGWTDLGYRLARSHWGRGLATEAAVAWVRAARDLLDLPSLGAFAHVDNAASLRVLVKVGFRETDRRVVINIPAVVFTMPLR